MKLTKIANNGLSQEKDVPGLLSYRIDYEVKSGKGGLIYTGPKFTPQMWYEVMSFFRWTHKEMDSESQVRLYVNTKLARWGAWAFPQEARTGMSAREIAQPETPEQAVERFASWKSEPSGDWLYFCTVHHHCSLSAFQSGTDEENERNQDGLHITVGRMDADRHDIHARFYLAGNCFEPDMSLFWPVEPELAEQVPSTMLDQVARFQMCGKVVVDFPDAWRKNVVETKGLVRASDAGGFHGDWRPFSEPINNEAPVWIRAEQALRDISQQFEGNVVAEEEFTAMLKSMSKDPVESIVIEACLRHGVTPDDILSEVLQYELGY
jgi:hypothetical protein